MEVVIDIEGNQVNSKQVVGLDAQVWKPMLCMPVYKVTDSANESRSWYFTPDEPLLSDDELVKLVNGTDKVECFDADGKAFDMNGKVTGDLTLVLTNNTHNVTLELDWTILGNSTSESAIKDQIAQVLGDEDLVLDVTIATNENGIVTSVVVDVSGMQAAQVLVDFIDKLDKDSECTFGVLCRTQGTKVDQLPSKPSTSGVGTPQQNTWFVLFALLLAICVSIQ